MIEEEMSKISSGIKVAISEIKAAVPKNSRPCEYFERLIAFGSGPNNGNQIV
jgi:hypothetical protein